MNFLNDALWFGEQVAGSLNRGGVTREEMTQRFPIVDTKDRQRTLSKQMFLNVRLQAEELFDCIFVCDKRTNRWRVEGDAEDERSFVDKVRYLRMFKER